MKMNQDLYSLDRISFLANNVFKRCYIPLIASLCVYAFNLSHHCSLRAAQCIDGYWLDHWLIGYDSGFNRRGLLGWMHKLLVGETLNIQALHIFAYFLIALIFFIVYVSLRAAVSTATSKKLIAVMFALPILSVFFETLGDPMHLCIGIYGASCIAISRIRIRWVNAFIAVLTVVLTSLIHEASLFLIAPAYVLIATSANHRGPQIRPAFVAIFMIYFASLLIYLLLMLKGSFGGGEELATGAVKAYNAITGATYTYSGSQSATFVDLLKGEYNLYYSSFQSIIKFVLKPLGSGLVPISFLLLVCSLYKAKESAMTLWKAWLFVSLSSLPLYVIAHDWGRFAIYNLIISFIATLLFSIPTGISFSGKEKKLRPRELKRVAVIAVFALAIAFAAYPIHGSYRIDGLPLRGTLAIVTGSIAFLAAKAGQKVLQLRA